MSPLFGIEKRSSLICIRDKNLHESFLGLFNESKDSSKKGRFWSYKEIP
jgi:hypothetical protein